MVRKTVIFEMGINFGQFYLWLQTFWLESEKVFSQFHIWLQFFFFEKEQIFSQLYIWYKKFLFERDFCSQFYIWLT